MRLAAIALAVSLAGCASSGTQVTQEQAQSFQPGKSTFGEVVASLGQPTALSTSSNGMKVAVYSYASVASRPQNFIPYIGPLVSGYDTRSSAVAFVFDARDILVSYNSTQGTNATGANLAAGQPRQ